ncbi:LCP family protein [Romboutsia sp.]|uniref:LCP family protein n=1 Tax=Romboutsia sp. TaxID=1965302 RepID=UPI003F3F9765
MKNMKFGIILFLLVIVSFLFIKNSYALEPKEEYTREDMVENILLIGRDGANNNFSSRSDTMIILTIDSLNESLKLTSLTRDTLVKIPNRGYEKLNHAYAYGKEDLLLKTINENFDLNIKDYAVVDFKSFIEIIDIIGGVDIEVSEREINHLNKIIEACYGLNSKKGEIEYITTSGIQNLNGYQALAYARIRKIDTIYKRDERQRIILTNIADKLSNTPITKYPYIVKSLLRYVDVNIAFNKIIKLALASHEFGSYEIKQLEFPVEAYRYETRIGEKRTYVIKWYEDKNKEILHRFIYEN